MKFIICALLIGSIAITAQSASITDNLSSLVEDLTSGTGTETGLLSKVLDNVNSGVLKKLLELIQKLLSGEGDINPENLGTIEGATKQVLGAVQKISGNDSGKKDLQETLSSLLKVVQEALSKSSDGQVPDEQKASVETVLEAAGEALGGLNGQN